MRFRHRYLLAVAIVLIMIALLSALAGAFVNRDLDTSLKLRGSIEALRS